MGSFDITPEEIRANARRPIFEVVLTDDDLDVLTTALWDLAALHSTYPRRHLERLHQIRRYLLAVQVPRSGGFAWKEGLPAPSPEST
jgi:hypothetical protein